MISQQINSYAKNASKKRDFTYNVPMNNCIESKDFFMLDFSKTSKNDTFKLLGPFNIGDSFQQAKSVVDELIDISTSESEEVSAREVFSKNNIFSPRKILIKNCIEESNIKNEVPISTQIIEKRVDPINNCVNAFSHNNCNEISLLLGQHEKGKEENLGSSLKLVENNEHQLEKVESMVSHSNETNNINSNFRNSNNHLGVNILHQKENTMKPKQRIGINIFIQKNSSEQSNFSLINKEKNNYKIHLNEAKKNMENSSVVDASLCIQKSLSSPLSSIANELAHIQKDVFQNNNLDSSCTTTTISPPHEKNPSLIDLEVLKSDNKSKEKSCDLKTLDAIDKRLHDIPFSCSKVICSNCKDNSINMFNSYYEIRDDDRVIDRSMQRGLEFSKESCLTSQPNALSIQENHIERGGKRTFCDCNIIHNTYIEPANSIEFSHLNTKLESTLHLLKANVKEPTKTNNDIDDDEINIEKGIQNFKSNLKLPHILQKEHNYKHEVFDKPIYLNVPPMHVHTIECYNNNKLKEEKTSQSSNAMGVELNFDRNEISSLSYSNCSTQQDKINFPCFVKLPNNLTCAIEHVDDIIQKQHFCSTLVHCRECCNINMKYNSCKSSLPHNLKNDLDFSTTSTITSNTKTIEHSNNLDNECKPHINVACKVDDEKYKDMKEIFDANDIQQYPQVLQEYNRSITQSETTLGVGAKNDKDILCSTRAHIPSMICAQAGYILEKKKATLVIEKTKVENLIQKGDLQHELNKQLISIFRSKLGEYQKLCLEIQNLDKKISNDETYFQLSQSREEKQNKELMKEKMQIEIVELYNVHRNLQAQLDIDNCLLVESLMALDTLTLDVENAHIEVEKLMNEEDVDQQLVFEAPKSNLDFEMNIVGTTCNNETFELSKAMRTMIKIQQNRYRSAIDENSLNNDYKNYSSIINEILNKKTYKVDEICTTSKIDLECPNKLDDTIMPTMASLSSTSPKLKSDSNSTKTMAMLIVDSANKQDTNAEDNIFGNDNILQWLKKNLHNKTSNPIEKSKNERCESCDDMFNSNCFEQMSNNNDIVSRTTNEPIDCNDSCSTTTTLCSNHYYDTLQCKQRQKHEKCDIHGTNLKMVCAYSTCKLPNPTKIKRDVIQRYKMYNTYNKNKSLQNKKSNHSKLKSLHQNTRIVKSISTSEQVFEKYKTLGYTKRAHDHLNEFDSDLLFSNKQRNILAKCHAMKVTNKELKNMIDDTMTPNQGIDEKSIIKNLR